MTRYSDSDIDPGFERAAMTEWFDNVRYDKRRRPNELPPLDPEED